MTFQSKDCGELEERECLCVCEGERQTDRQRHTDRDRQTDRQHDRQTDRKEDRDRERCTGRRWLVSSASK